MDRGCPNYSLHVQQGENTEGRHPIDHTTWLRLLNDQLQRTRDRGLEPVRSQGTGELLYGARGNLFRVTLMEYGYTFVAKATVKDFVPYLQHEAKIYQRLRPLQSADLESHFCWEFREYIVHMLFLSWGGDMITWDDYFGDAKLRKEIHESVDKLHELGVMHNDVRLANVLWCKETGHLGNAD